MSGWVYFLMAGGLGLLLGMLLMYLFQRKSTTSPDVKTIQKQLDSYQNQVENHFAKTADLIDNLTDSYQQVFEHLSESAEDLLSEEQIKNQLAGRKSREVTIKYLKGDFQETKKPPESE